MSKIAVWITACSVAAALAAAPAFGIINGSPDRDGHPNVGAVVADVPGVGRVPVCSGTLVAPTVFLTAAHCTAPLEAIGVTRVWVTLDPVLDVRRGLHSGTSHTDPAYGHDRADLHDLAVVELDKPVRGVNPAVLPTAGLLDGVSTQSSFTLVGYGVTAPGAVADGVRRVATAPMAALTTAWLRLLQTTQATEQGGVCYGDSGGPTFLGTTIVAVTSGGSTTCRGSDFQYRLDTPSARGFLGAYVSLP